MIETATTMPAWMSLVPPLLAIVVAFIFREVVSALISGIVVGCIILGYYNDGVSGMFSSLLEPVSLVRDAITPTSGNQDHISVIIFSLLIGGMASIITGNGSMNAMVERIALKATSKRRGLLVTWLMGIIVFFDDYANTMVVGSTMRPLTDKLKISREKLAYVVDSTAAPIAAIALVTTWIGAELNFIEDGVAKLVDFPFQTSTYLMFLESLKYSFYPIFTLFFILVLILTKKDFGPMLSAERDPKTSIVEAEEIHEHGQIWRGIVPIVIVLVGTIVGLFATGYDVTIWNNNSLVFFQKIGLIIGASNPYISLMWASFWSVVIAILLSIKSLGLGGSVERMIDGFKKMLPAIIILILAWSLAELTSIMGTAEFISNSVQGRISPVWLPAITFILAAIIAFSTGSSWGTMAILYPVIITTSWMVGSQYGLDINENYQILLNTISCVLTGSVLGDHCSPISDTTILSSLACDCDHIAHVSTQMPYALLVGVVSLIAGTFLSSLGLPSVFCFMIGGFVLVLAVSYFGKMSE